MSKSKYIPVTEVAKLIRQCLKEAFPGVKFRVRSDKYAGGASIGVIWIDGPSTVQVEAITDRFASTYYDMKRDYWEHLRHRLNGDLVSFGSHHVQCHRQHSDAWCAAAIETAYALNQDLLAARGVPAPTVRDFFDGRLHAVRLMPIGVEAPTEDDSPLGDPMAPHYPSLMDVVQHALRERSDCAVPTNSSTAMSVELLAADNPGVSLTAAGWARTTH